MNNNTKSHVVATAVMTWFLLSPANADTKEFAQRAIATGNTLGKVFAVIDKKSATVSLFDPSGKFLAASPVLLGQAKGDTSAPGIGTKPIAAIAPHERTTPAGRFESEPGKTLTGQTVVWIDYEAAVSMHPLRPSSSSEMRPERMATATPLDNRITYGCVNVPADFYDRWILPTLGQSRGIVYVLPEIRLARDWFSFMR